MAIWPFTSWGRRRAVEPDTRPDTAATPPEAAPRSVRPPTGAWRHLPPLAPTSASLALTAPVQRLADTITSRQRPQVVAPELRHARSANAPTGSVAGLIAPRGGNRTVDWSAPMPFAVAPEPVPVADAVPLWPSVQRLPSASPPQASTPPTSAAAPPSRAGVVAPSRAPRPSTEFTAAGRATSSNPLSSATPPPPAVGDVAAGPTGTASAASPGPERAGTMPAPVPRRMTVAVPRAAAASTSGRVPLSAPVAVPPRPTTESPSADAPSASTASPTTSPAATPTADHEPIQRLPSGDATATPVAVERTIETTPSRPDAPLLGSTRTIRRVGAPLRERPATMGTGTAAHGPHPSPPMPVAHAAPSEDHVVRRSAPTDRPSPAPPEPPDAGELPAGEPRRLRVDDSPKRPDARPSPRTHPNATRPLVGSTSPIQRLAASAAPVRIPDRPAAPDVVPVTRGVQRLAESVPATVRADLEPRLGASLADVKVHRGPDAGAAAAAVQAKAFAAGGSVVLPDEHGSMSSGEGRKILSHELTHVVQQRALGDSLPSEESSAGQRLEAQARAVGGQDPVPTRPAPRPAVGGPRQRLPSPSLPTVVRPLAAASASTPSAVDSATATITSQASIAAVVQQAALSAGIPSTPTASHDAPAAAAGLDVQRLPVAPASAPVANPSASPTTTSQVSAPRAAGGGTTPTDMDDLARQLYPRFRARLRSDLLLDRERSGRLFDGSGR